MAEHGSGAGQGRRETAGRRASNVNLPIVVPYANVALEDFVICFAALMLCNGASSILGIFWQEASTFCIVIGVCAAISLYIFAYRKRKAEIQMRGYSRIGILRRYFAFFLGGDWLLGR